MPGYHLERLPGRPTPAELNRKLGPVDWVQIEALGREAIEFAKFSLQVFEDIVLKDTKYKYVDIILSDPYTHRTYNTGTVDENNCVNFYDGKIRVVGPDGKEHAKYDADDYQQYIGERVEPWSYLKFPYLKGVGWKGFVDGMDSGVYCATPLSRLNASDGMATPKAQEAFEKMYETLGSAKINERYQPVHHTLAAHWARLVELLYASERMLELSTDPEITDPNVRAVVTETPDEGVGCVEAPRGILFHRYAFNDKGECIRANICIPTYQNHANIQKDFEAFVPKILDRDQDQVRLLLEMLVRSYDPCISCSTHYLDVEFV